MAAVIGALRAELSVETATFEADLGKASKAVEQFGKDCEAIGAKLQDVGAKMTLALTTPLLAFAAVSRKSAKDANAALAQVENRLNNMGGASGKTSAELQKSAKELENLSTFDKTDILGKVTENLLSFGRISGTIFDRAQKAAVNYAAGSGKALDSASTMIGKALEDPIKGLSALTEAGIVFTDAQEKQVKALIKSGQGVAAQNIILAELEKRYNGAAEAARAANPDAAFLNAWSDFQEIVGQIVLKFLPPLTALLTSVVEAFNNLSPATQGVAVALAGIVAAAGPFLIFIGQLVTAVGTLTPFITGMTAALSEFVAAGTLSSLAAGFGIMGAAIAGLAVIIGAILVNIWKFRDVIIDAFSEVVAYWQSTVGPAFADLFTSLGNLFDGARSGPIGKFFEFVGWALAELLAIFTKILGYGIGAVLTGFIRLVDTMVKNVGSLLGLLGDLLTGDFAGAWEHAEDIVRQTIGGVLDALDAILPGIRGAVVAIYEAAQEFLADRIADALTWIESRFPGLVDAVKSMAQGAVAWARNLYTGIKTWISDNLGPLIQWAKDRIRELNNLFAQIRGRQAAVAAGSNAPAPAATTPAPGGGGGGGGGGSAPAFRQGGGGGRSRSSSDNAAKRLEAATKRFAEGLRDLNDGVDKAFDEQALPKATAKANALRAKIDDIRQDAQQAGVDVSKFAKEISDLQTEIARLETEGLAKEAREFRLEVEKSGRAVNQFARGGLPPLEAALQQVDDRFEGLRQGITKQIEDNRVLASSNAEAAAAMVALEAQLAALGNAHVAAAESARAQYAAESALADLDARRAELNTQQQIDDLRQGRGEGAPISSRQAEVMAAEQDLARVRLDTLTHLRELELRRDEALRVGDTEAAARLSGQIALQTELYDLVSETTAVQITAAKRVNDAFKSFTDSLTDNLTEAVANWKGDLDGLRGIFKDLAKELFLKPVVSSFSEGIGGFLKSFAGGFATGGTMPAGKWGVVGEDGPELAYGGRSAMTIFPHGEGPGGGGGGTVVNQYITTPDADSFRKSKRQVAGDMKRAVNFS